MVLYCPNCGSKLPQRAVYCMACGTKIEHERDADTDRSQTEVRAATREEVEAARELMRSRQFFDIEERRIVDEQKASGCERCGGSGRLECQRCDGTGECAAKCDEGACPKCHGYGTLCRYCKGSGECIKCGGTGKCNLCDGEGIDGMGVRCAQCNGSGLCSYCEGGQCAACGGTGACLECQYESTQYYQDEVSCYGEGSCVNCNATGNCPRCQGTNFCTTCGGTGKGKKVLFGKSHCPDCHGSGKCPFCTGGNCPVCGGDGMCPNVCRTCNGAGECMVCKGEGVCPDCDGEGWVLCPQCQPPVEPSPESGSAS